jgi:hypothetical protein
MIVNDFDFFGTAFNPTKNNAVLRVDANGVKAFCQISRQLVARRFLQQKTPQILRG